MCIRDSYTSVPIPSRSYISNHPPRHPTISFWVLSSFYLWLWFHLSSFPPLLLSAAMSFRVCRISSSLAGSNWKPPLRCSHPAASACIPIIAIKSIATHLQFLNSRSEGFWLVLSYSVELEMTFGHHITRTILKSRLLNVCNLSVNWIASHTRSAFDKIIIVHVKCCVWQADVTFDL